MEVDKRRKSMLKVTAGSVFAHLEYAVIVNKDLLILSCYERSQMAVNGVCANIGLRSEPMRIIENGEIVASVQGEFKSDTYIARIPAGKETVYQGVCVSKLVNKEYLFIHKENQEEEMYAYFMNAYELPLLREWIPYLVECAVTKQYLVYANAEIYGCFALHEETAILECKMTNDDLVALVKEGLEQRKIRIAVHPQNALTFCDMDDYFEKYGHTLVKNLEKHLNPLSQLKEKVDELVFISKRPYPQQAAIINGALERLRYGNYVFLVESMGAGKTLQGMGIIDGWFVKQYMKQHAGVSVKDVYSDGSLVKYRTIIMCPPHLVEKWAESIREEVPYAKVEILKELAQLVKLRKKGKNPQGKEFYIISKDSGKLSYSYMPIPSQIKKRAAGIPVCRNCKNVVSGGQGSVCQCGTKEREIRKTRERYLGLVCPECGEILLCAEGNVYDENGYLKILMPEDFAVQNSMNHFCRCCGANLWAPAVKQNDNRIFFQKPKKKIQKWKKISHFTNRAKKARKSVWVLKGREEVYKTENMITDEEIEEMEAVGPRRYSMTRYIKKYLKGYFDLAVFDEVQDYKAGGSAQGYAMHDLIKASKKQMCLTGTIAAGYASDLFYTLYRLDPARMRGKGYEYGSAGEKKFVEKYGSVETVYEIQEQGQYHAMTRGKVITPTRCLPGISPLIFTDFLLDTALFLDISDLSRFLPNLYESVEIVPIEDEIREEYHRVRDRIKMYMKEEEKGSLLMGSFLQFSLSYTDMPYKREAILSPANGEEVSQPADLSYLIEDGRLLLKEQALVKIVRKELEEKRNCFIYCEFTGDKEEAISYRLMKILEQECNLRENEVTVLESSNPPALKREEWMHQKASQGTKVFITNAKCVSTGLDFAFCYQGKDYNYPTIIFYQVGYDMIKIWQASRRHYRLNQKKECRTFYLVSECTIQIDAVQLVATKEVATSSIQGQFSAEGLSTMAKGVDARVILAQSVAEKSEQKERGLKQMIAAINERNNQGKGDMNYEKMLIFSELTGFETVPDYDGTSEFSHISNEEILELLNFGMETTERQTNIFETGLQEEVPVRQTLHITQTVKNEVGHEEKDWLDFEELLNVVIY